MYANPAGCPVASMIGTAKTQDGAVVKKAKKR
jgi:hypothetical protein